MLKKYLYIFIFACILEYAAYGKSNISIESLPNKALSFIKETYPNIYIEKIKFDKGIYDVKLVNDVKISFTQDGIWIKIDSYYNKIPENILPDTIVNYIHSNMNEYRIIDIEKSGEVYKILFSNGITLKIVSDGSVLYRSIK